MKGLLISLSVVVAFIVAGFGASVLVYINLNNSIVTAHGTGSDEGFSDGYESGLIQGGIAGYQEGSKEGYLTSNRKAETANESDNFYFIYNPTYADLQLILEEVELDEAQEFIDYAAIHAIRIAYVRCQTIPNGERGKVYLHELVGFDTVDKGFIIIDPETHREVQVKVGVSYTGLNSLPASSHDDTIDKIHIIW